MQNDQGNCRKVFKQVLAKDLLEKRWKNMIFLFFSRPPPPPPRRRPRRRLLSTPVWGPLLGLCEDLGGAARAQFPDNIKKNIEKTWKNMILHNFSSDFQLVGSDA